MATSKKADSGPITSSFLNAITEAPILDRDQGAVQLALTYARRLDADPDALSDLGPKFLAVLNALGLTPASRNPRGATGGASGPSTEALDALRKRAQLRIVGA